MSEPKFLYKELLTHGWERTKKYWNIIFILIAIYLVVSVGNAVMQYFSGAPVKSFEMRAVYKDSLQAKKLYQYIQDKGYINQYGVVQEKLQQVTNPSDLELSSDFENQRNLIYSTLNDHRYRLPFSKKLFYLFDFAMWILGMLMTIGFLKSFLMISRDEGEPEIDELFSNWSLLIPYLLGVVCYGLVILGGFILLIIPGIIFMLMFQLSFYLIIDKGLGPLEALKRSRKITKGSRGRLAVLWLLLMILNVVGLLCLVIGVFVTLSVSAIALAKVYDILENSDNASSGQLEVGTLS